MSISGSVVTNRDRDCLGCRVVSGAGLIGAGAYVLHHARRYEKRVAKFAGGSFGLTLALLGSARLLDLPPFRDQFHRQQL